MSFPFDIPCGSPLVAIEAWTPDDLVQFAHRAAAGVDSSMLAQVSAVEEQVVEALLAEPVIAALVEEYGRMLEMSDEEFRARLRPFVRMVIEHEVRKPKPKGPFLFFLFFCLEIADSDPVQEIIKSLLRSLRRKREMSRRARAAAERRPPPPTRNPKQREEPTEKELLAENMMRFASRGRRFLALKIAEELASRNLAFGRSHRCDALCDPHEPPPFPGRYRASRYMSAVPVLAAAAPRPRRECEVSKGVQVAAGANEDAIQRPSIQHQAIEKADVTAPEKVIEGCGDRVDPHIYTSSSPYPDKCPQAP